jgi:hypothetical protein
VIFFQFFPKFPLDSGSKHCISVFSYCFLICEASISYCDHLGV